ncbi:hypothetical protein [uncultured Microscilla sp.]|uniref:hypothetical protein n=1 Tax=uncultured Microscilla sp. TaxID=432653 RepID=UPI002625DD8A|nr:hypothetical protein [uncultured Microscilla sp.]
MYTGKVYYFNGDYIGGFGVSETAIGYDFIALFLRLTLIQQLNQVKIKTPWVLITTLVIIYFNLMFLVYNAY